MNQKEIKKILEQIDSINPDEISPSDLSRMNSLLEQYDKASTEYQILDFLPSEKQQLLVDEITLRQKGESTKKYYLCWGGNGFWKCSDFSDLVLNSHWEYVKCWEIQVWDELMWPDSKPRKVLQTTTGHWQLYTVQISNWEDIHVNIDHKMVMIDRRRLSQWKRTEKRRYLDRKVNKEFEPTWEIKIMTLGEYMALWKRRKHEMYLWSPTSVEFNNNKELRLDSYFMWLWLGDWNSRMPTITNIDDEIIEYIYDFADENEMEITIKQDINYNLISRKTKNNKILDKLRSYNLIKNKHIPQDYKTASIEDRYAILAGLIDSDWSITWNAYEITQKKEVIIDDIIFIAKSLWLRASKNIHMKSCTNWKDKRKKPYYHVYISWEVWKIPVKIERKKIREFKLSRNPRMSRIESIEEYKIDNWYWFELDWDHRYLDVNFNVQHNTIIGAYICVCMALWNLTKKIGLPYIWAKKDIIIGTQNSTSLQNIKTYLFSEKSPVRIPPEFIEGTKQLGDLLKEISFTNGAKIRIITYQQEYKAWEGHNPDFIWLDEEPIKDKVFSEAYERSRWINCEKLITMTPSGNSQTISDMFLFNENQEWQDKYVWSLRVAGFLDNPYASSEHIGGMTEEEKRRRVEWDFSPPAGMVYHQFADKNIMPHIDPFKSKEIWWDAEYYIGIDPGSSHGFAVVFLCKTSPYNDMPNVWYLYDELLFEGTDNPTSYIIDQIQYKIQMMWKKPKAIIIDSAARQVMVDLRSAWINCIPSDKRTLWKHKQSNKQAWIDEMNNLFHQGDFFVSTQCKKSIKQFRKHFYKEWEIDWAVNKRDDDLLDAMRYVIFFVLLSRKKKKIWY